MKIYTIVVLYNCDLHKSKTLNSLIATLNNNDIVNTVLIWDNGYDDQSQLVSNDFEYIHSKKNVGIAKAYNYAFENALKTNCEWLLLFDQDSIIPTNFFLDLNYELRILTHQNNVCAIVPRIHDKNYFFSPSKVLIGGIHRTLKSTHFGIYDKEIFAINSGSLINLNFLKKINGFEKIFWLDSLDRWFYMKVYENRGKVYISKSIIEHSLSIMDYKNSVSINRYKNILDYETLFILKHTNFLDILFFKFRLLIRTFKFLIIHKNLNFAFITFIKLFKITFNKKTNFINKFN